MTYETVAPLLVDMDPFRFNWQPVPACADRQTASIQRRLAGLRDRARAEQAGRGMREIAHQIASVDSSRAFGVFPDVPILAGRHAVVLAHGPGLSALLPTLSRFRDRLYVVAPFRTALRLAAAGIWPDIMVLADAAVPTAEISIAEWQALKGSMRRQFEEHVTLVTEPLAPAAIHQGFSRVRVFDNALGWLPAPAQLPYWGSALLPSLCIPLALGASTVAIGGMNMTAARGRRCRTWAGEAVRLDPGQEVPHGLLEVLAAAIPGRFLDLTPDAVVKRGFIVGGIDDLLARPAGGLQPAAVTAPVYASDLLHHTLQAAHSFGDTIARMSAIAGRVTELSRSDGDLTELHRLVETMECDWAREPACLEALALLQPPFLQSLWRLRRAGYTAQNAAVATRMKAKLIGPEIASLDGAYRQWLDAIRAGASGLGPVLASQSAGAE